ncbi:GNAT family N-acetyltransferase [Brevibacillus sp. SYSU BS000544]|uniref:GNAT family N-acetyltransferase n=1 Tax=Brevibacillus sp. SYSU BS000544 TaxID=3416443 RepID=UPI003CE56576
MSRNDLLKQVERIEQMEQELTVFNARRALSAVEKNLQVKKLGDCALLIDANSPQSIYYNRIKGFGMNDLNNLDEILDVYHKESLTPCFDMTPNHLNEEVAKALFDRGYVSAEQLAFLQWQPQWKDEHTHDLSIVAVTAENVDVLMDMISQSMGGVDQEIIDKKKAYFYQPHFQNYLAYVGDEAAGMGSLFLSGDAGYIANDYTIPQFRGRGCQSALVIHRMNEVKKMGLAQIYTDVEFGTTSHNNMLKLGFQTIFLNSFWIKRTQLD